MDTQWFLTRNGETIAQYSTEQFKRAVAKRVLRQTDYVRRSDSSTQISASEFLPATYQPRSAVPRVLGAIVAVVAVIAGIGYGVGVMAPAYLQTAFETLGKLNTEGNPKSAIRQAVLRQKLLADTTSGGFFLALSQKDPEAFEALLAQFADSLSTESADEVLPQVRAYLTKNIIEPRSHNLSDDDKAAMLALNRDMSLQLAATNPKMCLAHALAKPFGDVKAFITPELKAREEQIMLKLLDTEPQAFDVLPAKELQAINTKVGTSLYEKHGDEIGLLDLENAPEGKEEAACRMFAAYLDGVLTLPETERIALIRAMVLAPERLTAEETPAQETQTQDLSAGEPPPTIVTVPDAPASPSAEQEAPADPSAETQTADPADTASDAQAQ